MTVVLEGIKGNKGNQRLTGLEANPSKEIIIKYNSFKDLDYDKTVEENIKITKGATPIKLKDISSKLKPEIVNEYNYYPRSVFNRKAENAKSEFYTVEIAPKKKNDLGAKSKRLTVYIYDLGKNVPKSKKSKDVRRTYPRFKKDAVHPLFNTCGSSLFKNSCLVASVLKSLVQFYMKADKVIVDKFLTMFESIAPKDVEAKTSKTFTESIQSAVYNYEIKIVIDAYASQNPDVSIRVDRDTVRKIKPKTLKHQIMFINTVTNENLLSIKTVDYKGKISIDGKLVRGESKKIQILQPIYQEGGQDGKPWFRGCILRDVEVSTRVVSNDDFVKFWKKQKETVNTLANFKLITDTCTDGELESMVFK